MTCYSMYLFRITKMIDLLMTTGGSSSGGNWPEGLPGPQSLKTGNSTIGFFGEVSSSEFITYAALATAVGITTGTNPYPTEGWLKMAYNGNVQYMPKRAARANLPWATMNNLGIVTAAQNKLITILGKVYRVRLINACNVNPYPGSANVDDGIPYGNGTEWNKLMYGLMSTVVGAAALEGPALASYSIGDLGLAPTTSDGVSAIIQETTSTGLQIARGNGNSNVRGIYPFSGVANSDRIRGWRPVLEYVSG
ncbi:virion structural protein [Pseudomonas phage 201phi2-1]|uniref:Virion structural protein n=1 Tax=Pseudomonas phage 201phi2-1 TaxID=198110 RepID=B3FJW0_BP201|nr:virion structural protein [Pseudomonas phage 201phi2-1]ABY63275.1 virion structural protein [Pseudomonas phage 201phi2-1]